MILRKGSKVRIKAGSRIIQDFRCFITDKEDEAKIFTVRDIFKKPKTDEDGELWYMLIAPGYGTLTEPHSYGNGALYTSKINLKRA